MIIKSIKLNPFGGLVDKEISLDNGLNVIYGPNEAGKSTIFNGVQKVIFTPSKLNKKTKTYNEMQKYIPIGGGDTAKVEIQFLHGNDLFTLKKVWGGSMASELKLPDRTVITDEKSIQEKLESLLAAKEGTYRSILMAYQNGLAKTLEDLKENKDTVFSLGDIIQKTMHETDGVSVDKLNEEINSLYLKYFEHWDRENMRPQNGREVENPYKTKPGSILEAYYNKETIRKSFKRSREYDEAIGEINKKISACKKLINEKDLYVKENKKIVEDAKKHRIYIAEKNLLDLSTEKLSDVNNQWPVLEHKIDELKKKITVEKEEQKKLEQGQSLAEKKEQYNNLIQQHERVKKSKEKQDKATEELSLVKNLTEEDIKKIRSNNQKLETLQTKLKAGKLSVQFAAKKDLTISILKDLEEECSREIPADKTELFEAGGKLKLEHLDWVIEVSSGEEDTEEIIRDYRTAEKELKKLLMEYEVQSFDQALALHEEYRKRKNEFDIANRYLEMELGGVSYEDFCKKIDEFGPIQETRPLVDIVKELTELKNKIQNDEKESNQHQDQIEKYEKEYETKKKLLLSLAAKEAEKEELEKKILELIPLPDGVDDPEIFVKQYEKIVEELESAKDEKEELQKEWFEIERNAPDESSEEIEIKLKEAEDELFSVLRRGEAIARIQNLITKIQERDSSKYSDLKAEIEEHVLTLTNSRYTSVKMEESIPQGFIRNDGAFLDYDMLSAGTKDVLSLALRLSMAKYFLKEACGFLIMDDPLVDMDPVRQQKAGEVIQKFAENKQVIIFTCHPKHAEILGGNQIKL
jgi:exonuclease SbcC